MEVGKRNNENRSKIIFHRFSTIQIFIFPLNEINLYNKLESCKIMQIHKKSNKREKESLLFVIDSFTNSNIDGRQKNKKKKTKKKRETE